MKYDYSIKNIAHFYQHGITLLEALMAMLILALGILGLAVVQGRALVETRTTNARATAIRLIADLSERVHFNYLAQPQFSTSPYAMLSSEAFKPAAPTPPDSTCDPSDNTHPLTFCSAKEQAVYDVWTWRKKIGNVLPGGVAYISQVPNSQQLQVVVAWLANENSNTTVNEAAMSSRTAVSYQQLAEPLQIKFKGTDDNFCGATDDTRLQQAPAYICHVDFIGLPNSG